MIIMSLYAPYILVWPVVSGGFETFMVPTIFLMDEVVSMFGLGVVVETTVEREKLLIQPAVRSGAGRM